VEAAGYKGKPIYFDVIEPWTRPTRMAPPPTTRSDRVSRLTNFALVLLLLLGGTLLAVRNIRLGRGDRSGAIRLALFALVALTVAWALTASHVPDPSTELQLFMTAVGLFLFFSAFLWLMYLAIEPYVRRRWPHRIVSWSRCLAGHFRDPLVGRDILVGGAFGIVLLLLGQLEQLLPMWLNQPPPIPTGHILDSLLGVGNVVAQLLELSFGALINALAFLFLPLLFMVVLRREALAFGLLSLILVVFVISRVGAQPVQIVLACLYSAVVILVVTRFGLLATAAAMGFHFIARSLPMTADLSSWYAHVTFLTILPLLAVAAYGFYIALAGRPVFGVSVLQD
jgi:serine/threonine-protein kinase